MVINNTIFQVELIEILTELQRQLQINKIQLLQIIKDCNGDVMVQCPFHSQGQEKRPSAGIRKSDGKFHCFRCNCTHELPEVISYCLGYEKDILGIEGWKWLNKNYLSLGVEDRKDVRLNFLRSDNNNNNNSVTYDVIAEEELDQYRYYHPYWAKRGITDESIIELFDCGYDPKTNEITMPNYDKEGNCVFVARRSINSKRFSYPKDVQKIVYGIYQLYQLKEFPKEVYITESMIDCIYLWQFGYKAVALNGLGTIEQMKELNKMPCRKFILATDNDEAGMRAEKRIKKCLRNKLVMQVVFPQGRKDINELTVDEIKNLEVVF